jgi:hypothetical protein
MRAKEYIAANEGNIDRIADVKKVINDLYLLRKDTEKTTAYFKTIFSADIRGFDSCIEPGAFKEGEINGDFSLLFRHQLFVIVRADDSFSWLRFLLASGLSDEYPGDSFYNGYNWSRERMKYVMKINRDDYPKTSLDDYLKENINVKFYSQYSTGTDDDSRWLEIFNTAYYLFDEARIKMHEPIITYNFLKNHEFRDENERLVALRLVHVFLSHHIDLHEIVIDNFNNSVNDIDWTNEQRRQGKIVANELYKFLKTIQPEAEIERLKINTNSEFYCFNDIFTCQDWAKYIEVLIQCKPALLKKENNRYLFIGNAKTQKGCVAQWFKYLKAKGIINQSISRDDLAKVLMNEINNFRITGSSIDNQSNNYAKVFEEQLKNLLSII